MRERIIPLATSSGVPWENGLLSTTGRSQLEGNQQSPLHQCGWQGSCNIRLADYIYLSEIEAERKGHAHEQMTGSGLSLSSQKLGADEAQ